MGEETGFRSKFDLAPFYEHFLKFTAYSIYEVSLLRMRVECPNFKPSKHINLDIIYVYWCHYANAGVDKWLGGKCTLYKQETKNSSVDNVRCIFEDNYIFCGEF